MNSSTDAKVDWLRWYCGQGMRLLPCWQVNPDKVCACPKGPACPSPGKHPHISDWTNIASSDLDQVMAWHRQWPEANWGWALDRHLVIDIDPRNGAPTAEDLDTILGFTLPPTLTQNTGGGGEHLVYEQNGQVTRNGKLWHDGKKLPGVDVKGVGGYVMVAPSNHQSGRLYEWRNPNAPSVPAPGELYGALRKSPPKTPPKTSTRATNGEVDQDHEALDLDQWLAKGPTVACGDQRDHLLTGIGWMRERFYTRISAIALAGMVVSTYLTCDPGDPWTDQDVIELVDDLWNRYPQGERPDAHLVAWAQGVEVPSQSVQLPPEIAKRAGQIWVERQATGYVDAFELAQARGPRPKRAAREYAQVPQPDAVIMNVLAAEYNMLGGPSEAGKSLLARDWVLSVASGTAWRGYLVPQPRNVLWVASEGLHDFAMRWEAHPLWQYAADRVFVLDEPVDLVRGDDVDWLLKEYAAERPGLVVFDVIYGMGMADDNGVKDVVPVISSLKRISAEWGAATLAIGHPPLSGERRLRGSSMWRQLAATEWHMGDGRLSCEKSKLTDKRKLGAPYIAEYPALTWRSPEENMVDVATRRLAIEQDFEQRPGLSDRERAKLLGPMVGLGDRAARQLIRDVRLARKEVKIS
jgi:hypothetical protein